MNGGPFFGKNWGPFFGFQLIQSTQVPQKIVMLRQLQSCYGDFKFEKYILNRGFFSVGSVRFFYFSSVFRFKTEPTASLKLAYHGHYHLRIDDVTSVTFFGYVSYEQFFILKLLGFRYVEIFNMDVCRNHCISF